MESVAISSKFQVVIPKKTREALHLVPGQRVQVISYDGRIEMIPECRIGDMRGFLRGIDPTVARDDDRQ
jgi:AbrB family looped-hinge helix DNA binding protein